MTAAATVLLIDDDPAVRRGFARLLEAAGFGTVFADNGETGLQVLRDTEPQAVLLDLSMPGLSGLETLTLAAEQFPDTPIIVVSGSGVIDDVIQALRRGAWDYLTKPVAEPQVLLQTVRRTLEKAELIRENRAQRERLVQLNSQLSQALAELRTDEEAGRRIQFQLLPADGLRIGPYEFTRRLFPSQYLSGDFADYFPLDEQHAGMYIADVSGHGAASALVTTMLTALIGRYREALTRDESDLLLRPDKLMEALNRDLGLRKLNKHMTMFYGVLDLRSHRLAFSSAGQYPFPLLDDGKNVSVLECSGRPLGLFSDARFLQREISLAATRRLLLASDGVLEVLAERPGSTKLDELGSHLRAGLGIDAIVRNIGIEPEAHLSDDVTLLLLERRSVHA